MAEFSREFTSVASLPLAKQNSQTDILASLARRSWKVWKSFCTLTEGFAFGYCRSSFQDFIPPPLRSSGATRFFACAEIPIGSVVVRGRGRVGGRGRFIST